MGLATGMLITGAAVAATGSIVQGRAQRKAAEYNANIAEKNARIELERTAEEEKRFRVLARKEIGQIRANYAASGVRMEGSALDVLHDSAANAEADAISIRTEGRRRAQAYREGATLDRMQGRAGERAGYFGAASALLDGGSKAILSRAG